MIGLEANPDRFHAIINKRRKNAITHKLKIYNNEIETIKSVKLLDIEIDNQLSFNQHISKLYSRSVMQLNAICRSAKFMGNKDKIAMINSLFTPLLATVFLSGIFTHVNLCKK